MAQSTRFPVPSGAVATVKIIDTTSKIAKLPVEFLMTPPMPGFQYMPELPSWSFLVENPTGRKALFDLGIPKDWENMAPAVVKFVKEQGWDVEAQKNTSEILQENGYTLESIGSIIWRCVLVSMENMFSGKTGKSNLDSHWHWDHLGDPSTFPSSTELVVGPGFKANLMPGFPAKDGAPVRESDFA